MGRREPIDLCLPKPDERDRLMFLRVFMIRLGRSQNFAPRIARHAHLSDDAQYRPALQMKHATHQSDRNQSLQRPLHPLSRNGWSDEIGSGQDLCLNMSHQSGARHKGVSFGRRNEASRRELLRSIPHLAE